MPGISLEQIYNAERECRVIRPDGSQIVSSLASIGDITYHNQTKWHLEEENEKDREAKDSKNVTVTYKRDK